jgi:hypothetical protein
MRSTRVKVGAWALLAAIAAALLAATPSGAETAAQTLARRPLAPLDHSLLNGPNTIGRRVLYPDASAMTPAAGPAPSELQAGAMLDAYLAAEFPGNAVAQGAARAVFDDATAKAKVPNPSLRAALASLRGTFADAAVGYVLNSVDSVAFVAPSLGCGPQSPGWAACSFIAARGDIEFNSRYQYENPFLLTHLLAHEVLHSDASVADYEETTAYVLDALLYIDQLARHPSLATLGTEFARRSNSNAVALLNSGTGSQLGLYATNGNRQIFPGSTADRTTSWFADFASAVTTATPGAPVLGPYLAATHTPGAPACSAATFNKPLLDCLNANRSLGLTSDELAAAARALRLDTRVPVPPPGGNGGGGGTPTDRKPPTERLSGKSTQKLGKTVAVTVSCSEACTATATGTLSAGKVYRLAKSSRPLRAHHKLTLKLKLSARLRTAVRRALARHRKVRVKVKVVVKDAHGNRTSKTRTIRLKR